ncbi:hypothetical protein I79_026272 [Cricetulus griseus]|uniref:Uncharacterized protein n=1 Tax=Cricetulus griseus TaxID=10029 RepID=G3IQE0_CRIGR|nr:hypothetical protein I79_026272 [Cricetulus griseus]
MQVGGRVSECKEQDQRGPGMSSRPSRPRASPSTCSQNNQQKNHLVKYKDSP